MAFYKNRVYPHLVSVLGNPKPIQEIRRRILARADGRVLEIGVGPGVNFDYYDLTKVEKVFALEPNPGMLKRADEKRRGTRLEVEFLGLPGERIPLADASVDTVVSTFTLCTIPGVVEAIRGIGRVLKPGGNFIFFEHGRSPDVAVRRWQERSEPLFHWAFEGCHLTRDIPSLIHQGGFKIAEIEARYLARFPKMASYCWWGLAVPKRK
ncbi:MAG TPA: class I SAM-dependent methyltransferase [Terriglobia bacterium]|nr:class I SAM-dependent methyltransferase [Terriglobia bacterium]